MKLESKKLKYFNNEEIDKIQIKEMTDVGDDTQFIINVEYNNEIYEVLLNIDDNRFDLILTNADENWEENKQEEFLYIIGGNIMVKAIEEPVDEYKLEKGAENEPK